MNLNSLTNISPMHIYNLNTKTFIFTNYFSNFQVKCWVLPSIQEAIYFSKILIVLKKTKI